MKKTRSEKFQEWIFFTLMILFIAIPVSIQILQLCQFNKLKGDWLGFWGNYLGFLPTGVAGYLVYKFQIERDKHINLNGALKAHTDASKKQIDSTIKQFEYLLQSLDYQRSQLREKVIILPEEMVSFHLKINESMLHETNLFLPIFTDKSVRNEISIIMAEIMNINRQVLEWKKPNSSDYEKMLAQYEKLLINSKSTLAALKANEDIRSIANSVQM